MTQIEIAQAHQRQLDIRRGQPHTGMEKLAVISRRFLIDLIAKSQPDMAAKMGVHMENVAACAVKNGITDKEATDELKKRVIIATLCAHKLNICKAAMALHKHRNTLMRDIKELGIDMKALRKQRVKQ